MSDKPAKISRDVLAVESKAEDLDPKSLNVAVDVFAFAQAAHWITDEKSNNKGNLDQLTKNLHEIGGEDAALIIQYYNLGFAEGKGASSDIGRELHQAFIDNIPPAYVEKGTPLMDARLFKPENYTSMFNQDAGMEVTYSQLPGLVHDHAGFFKWIESYSFVDPEMLQEGTDLRNALEDIFQRHADKNTGEIELPFFVQTMTGKVAASRPGAHL